MILGILAVHQLDDIKNEIIAYLSAHPELDTEMVEFLNRILNK